MSVRPDSPIDVCSHKRSGTHYLMATLWHNFELPDLTVTTTMIRGKQFLDHDGSVVCQGEIARIRWGGLWLTHGCIDSSMQRDKVVYVVRDPVETLMSYWRFNDPLMEDAPAKFIGYGRVNLWYRQTVSYLQACCTIVRYEDLAGAKHDDVLSMLENKFGLQRKREKFERFERRVGWYSSIEPQQASEAPKLLLNAVDVGLPKGFMGYNR